MEKTPRERVRLGPQQPQVHVKSSRGERRWARRAVHAARPAAKTTHLDLCSLCVGRCGTAGRAWGPRGKGERGREWGGKGGGGRMHLCGAWPSPHSGLWEWVSGALVSKTTTPFRDRSFLGHFLAAFVHALCCLLDTLSPFSSLSPFLSNPPTHTPPQVLTSHHQDEAHAPRPPALRDGRPRLGLPPSHQYVTNLRRVCVHAAINKCQGGRPT